MADGRRPSAFQQTGVAEYLCQQWDEWSRSCTKGRFLERPAVPLFGLPKDIGRIARSTAAGADTLLALVNAQRQVWLLEGQFEQLGSERAEIMRLRHDVDDLKKSIRAARKRTEAAEDRIEQANAEAERIRAANEELAQKAAEKAAEEEKGYVLTQNERQLLQALRDMIDWFDPDQTYTRGKSSEPRWGSASNLDQSSPFSNTGQPESHGHGSSCDRAELPYDDSIPVSSPSPRAKSGHHHAFGINHRLLNAEIGKLCHTVHGYDHEPSGPAVQQLDAELNELREIVFTAGPKARGLVHE